MRVAARILLASLALLGVAILAVCIAAVALSQGWQRERLREAAEELLAGSLDDVVAIGSLEGPLLPRVGLTDLRVGAPDAPTLTVERLSLRVAWRRSLSERRLVLRSAEVDGAHLALSRDAEGTWRLPPWLAGEADDTEESEKEAPLGIRVERTALRDLSARIAWQEEDGEAALLLTGGAELAPWSLPAEGELRGSLSVRAQGEGVASRWLELASLEAEVDGPRISLSSLAVDGGAHPPLRLGAPAALVIEDGRVRFEALELRSDAQAIVARGAVSAERFFDLHVDLRDLDVTLAGALLGGAAHPGGRVGGTLDLDGPLLQPEGRVDLVWSEPSLGDWRVERVALRASGDGRSLRIETLAIDGAPGGPLRLVRPAELRLRSDAVEIRDFALRSAGQTLLASGGVSARGFQQLALELRALDVELLARLAGLDGDAGGTLGGEVRLDGDFRAPTGQVDLAWQAPRLRGWHGERIALRADADGRRVRLDARLLRDGRDAFIAEAELPGEVLERSLRGRPPSVSARELPEGLHASIRADRADLVPLAPLLPEALHGLRGTLSGSLEVEGGPEPRYGGELVLEDGALAVSGRAPIAPLRAELALEPEPGALRVERLRVTAQAFTLTASGTPGLDAPADLHVALEVEDLEALAAALELNAPLAGSLDAEASLRGAWPRPAIRGDASWTHPAPGVARPHRVDLVLESDDRELTGTVAVHQRARVAARGTLRMPYPDAGIAALGDATQHAVLELRADDFDLATVAPLLPRLVRDLQGRADAEITARAGPGTPSFAGSLRVTDGSLRVPALRQTFFPIELDARFADDAVRIAQLRVGREGADANASGRVRLGIGEQAGSIDLDIALERLPIARARPLTTDVSGDLQLAGPFDALRLEGELALSDTQVRLVDAGDPALREIEVVTSDAQRLSRQEMRERARETDAFERASIDVALTVPRNSWVRGRGADIDLTGALRLEKAPGDVPRLSGEVDAVRGNYRFQGKRFDIRRGSVSFSGSAQPDPSLDIEADHRVRSVTIVIHLTGHLSEPLVTLTSEPPLPEDDVLSYLFFGRPTSELGASQPARDLDRAATALAAGIALREAARLVEDAMPVDTIDVQIEEDGTRGNVGVGKYLTDDLFIRYERGFGQEAVDGVKIELRLDENWSVEGEASTDESAGADLVWSFDY